VIPKALAIIRVVLLASLVCAVLTFAPRPAAAATYTYIGNPFTLFSSGPDPTDTGFTLSTIPAPANSFTTYTATNKVTATLTLTSPLPANFAYADISGLPGFQLTMNDGQQTLSTPVDPATQDMGAFVSTDATGNINQCNLFIDGVPLTLYGIANQGGGIFIRNFTDIRGSHVADEVDLACCDPTNTDAAENVGLRGVWNPTPATSVNNLMGVISNPLLGLTSGQGSSLTNKLNNALASIQAGLNKQAINQLSAFISSVQAAVKTNKMSAQTGTTLINAANAIILALSS
jgi:hypothetical protein